MPEMPKPTTVRGVVHQPYSETLLVKELDEAPPLANDTKVARHPLFGGLRRLLTSSKGLLALIALFVVAYLSIRGRIDGDQTVRALLAVLGLYGGATALEDGLAKRAG